MTTPDDRIRAHLSVLYGSERAAEVWRELDARLARFAERRGARAASSTTDRLTERDSILITYGDQVRESGKPPLQSLDELLTSVAGDVLTAVHLLPFYPYSSDDGFSVIDFLQVDPELGDWQDIAQLNQHFRLMFDAVINHISQYSQWFQGFLRSEAPYTDYFLAIEPGTDVSMVVRPRTHPLLTPFETAQGIRHVWTTFSADQIDLNYGNPQVLLEMIDVLLFYVEHGAEIIRLDAIAYLWKRLGTGSIHLTETHAVVKLWRAMLDRVAPEVLLITETNVPHVENISYFGDGVDEAQLVYQFPLPPLTLHAFIRGDARYLQQWAADLITPSDQTTFFNFLASHDGIGVRPVEGILPRTEVDALVERTQSHGGFVSFKTNVDGSQSPYELNITYYDALNGPDADEPQSLQVDRFMASQAILLSLAGVPGIYVHSLFGSRNWRAGVERTGHNRTINRQKFVRSELESALRDPDSVRHAVFNRYRALLQARMSEPAFHPNGSQEVIASRPALFSFVRTAPDGGSRVLCIHNVSAMEQTFAASLDLPAGATLTDLLSTTTVPVADDGSVTLTIPPYGVRWLRQR